MLFLPLVEMNVFCFTQIDFFGVVSDRIWPLMQFSTTSAHATSCQIVYINNAAPIGYYLDTLKGRNSKRNNSGVTINQILS